MSIKDRLDQHSQLFYRNWTRPKRTHSQVNGETEMSQSTYILRKDVKARQS